MVISGDREIIRIPGEKPVNIFQRINEYTQDLLVFRGSVKGQPGIIKEIPVISGRPKTSIPGSSGSISRVISGDREIIRIPGEKPVNIFQRINEYSQDLLVFRASVQVQPGIIKEIPEIPVISERPKTSISGSPGSVSRVISGDREIIRIPGEKPVNIFQRINEYGQDLLVFRGSVQVQPGIIKEIPVIPEISERPKTSIPGSSGSISRVISGDREIIRIPGEKPVNIFQRINEYSQDLVFRGSVKEQPGIIKEIPVIPERPKTSISGSSGSVSPVISGDREIIRIPGEKPVNIFQRINEYTQNSLTFRASVQVQPGIIKEIPVISERPKTSISGSPGSVSRIIFGNRGFNRIYDEEPVDTFDRINGYSQNSLIFRRSERENSPIIYPEVDVSKNNELNSLELVYKKHLPETINDSIKPLEEKIITSENRIISKITTSIEEHIHDTEMIAEEVYELIEKKIEIERDRRGIL
jgi:hypothetical protein